MIKKFHITCVILFSCYNVLIVGICPLKICKDESLKPQYVEEYCKLNNATMFGRCCIENKTKDVIGLDIRFCGLTTLNITVVDFKNVAILDLRENKLESAPEKVFVGLTKLEELYLPSNCECPGNDSAWRNSSDTGNETQCLTQLNPCDYMNVSCSLNGMCLHTGPGSAKCVCLPDHYGYKCLKQGEFPMKIFLIFLCIPTLVLSLGLWFNQRRNVRNVGKED